MELDKKDRQILDALQGAVRIRKVHLDKNERAKTAARNRKA